MKKIYSLIILSIFMSSCVDLTEETYDRLTMGEFPENEVQAALETGIPLEQLQQMLDWGGWWFCQEATSDELVFPTRHTDWDDGGKWRVLHLHTWTNTTEAITEMWFPWYKGIGEANRLIEKFGEEQTTDAGKAAIAKLKIIRAFYYYLLIDNYGDVPYETSFSEAVDFPYVTPRAEVWENIVKEVEEQAVFLDNGTTKTAVSKGMAYSLLAKLYLNAEVYSGTTNPDYWVKAEAACDSVLALNYSLESDPLAPFITENETSTENIFTIPYDEDEYTGFNVHMRTLHYNHNQTFDMTAGPWNGCAVIEDHYNTYEDTDLRKINGFLVGPQKTSSGATIIDATADSELIIDPEIPVLQMDLSYTYEQIRMSGARVSKFEIKMGAKENLSNDFPIFRLGDIYLMKAETMVRQGKAGAAEYVNPIRERAGVSSWSDADLTLDNLLAERGREMFFEGHRRQDQIRFGEFNKAWWEKDASSEDRNTFPIPQWVLDTNPNL